MRPVTQRLAQITPGDPEIALADSITVKIAEELVFVDRDLFKIQRVAGQDTQIFVERNAGAQPHAGGRLFVSRALPVVIAVILILPIQIDANGNIAVKNMRFGEADIARTRITRIVQSEADRLPATTEVILPDRTLENEAFKAGEARRKRQFAGRFFLHVRLQHDPVGRGAFDLLDFEILLEITQRVDPRGGPLDLQRAECIAFRQAEFAADYLVLRQRVAVNIDRFHIHARRIGHGEGNAHRAFVTVDFDIRAHIGEGITERARRFGEAFDGVVHLLCVVPVALGHLQRAGEQFAAKIAQLADHFDAAKLVAFAFFHHVGDDEIALVRGQFGHGGNHPEIGIALRQVELAQLLLIKRQPVWIIAGVGAENLEQPGFLRHHFAHQIAIRKHLVADDVDLANLGLWPFGDLENHIDAVLVEHHHLRFDTGGEPALAFVQFDDARHIGADFGAGEDLARGQIDFGIDLVVFQAAIAFQHDAVDHRIFGDGNHHHAVCVGDREVGEQFGRGQIDQRLIGARGSVNLAGAKLDIADDGGWFEPLCAGNADGADHVAHFCRGSGRRRRGSRRRRRVLRQCRAGQTGEHRTAHQGGSIMR